MFPIRSTIVEIFLPPCITATCSYRAQSTPKSFKTNPKFSKQIPRFQVHTEDTKVLHHVHIEQEIITLENKAHNSSLQDRLRDVQIIVQC